MAKNKSIIKITMRRGIDAGRVGALIEVLSGLNIIEKIESDVMIEVEKKKLITR